MLDCIKKKKQQQKKKKKKKKQTYVYIENKIDKGKMKPIFFYNNYTISKDNKWEQNTY